jgi:hypothetical protein
MCLLHCMQPLNITSETSTSVLCPTGKNSYWTVGRSDKGLVLAKHQRLRMQALRVAQAAVKAESCSYSVACRAPTWTMHSMPEAYSAQPCADCAPCVCRLWMRTALRRSLQECRAAGGPLILLQRPPPDCKASQQTWTQCLLPH